MLCLVETFIYLNQDILKHPFTLVYLCVGGANLFRQLLIGWGVSPHFSGPVLCTHRERERERESSGGLAVKHPTLGANGRRFEPRKRSKIKGDAKKPLRT